MKRGIESCDYCLGQDCAECLSLDHPTFQSSDSDPTRLAESMGLVFGKDGELLTGCVPVSTIGGRIKKQNR